MSKKLFIALLALIMGIACVFTACEGGNADISADDGEDPIDYQGEMLYNGFDTLKDLYAIDQLYEWGYTPVGNLNIVGQDNFIPEPEVESEEVINKIIAQINALPSKEEVTLADIDAVRKARKAYGALSDEGKKLITNISVLKDIESASTICNYYTLADLGGDFTSDIVGAGEWKGYNANLKNAKEGTIVFKASGLKADDGTLYVSIFHDPSENKNEASDGIMMFVAGETNQLYLNGYHNFNAGKAIDSSKTYVFYYTYKVADDYSKLTVSIRVDELGGDTIANVSNDITDFSLKHFAAQDVKSWLTTHKNKDEHQTFYINGGIGGANISSVWTGVSAKDYEEPAEDPHTAADLAPRQGEGALRVYYKGGSFKQIIARFERSSLSKLPKKELGALSVKVYNDSATEKSVTLSLVGEQNAIIDIEGGKFKLAPYAWTTCQVTLDPVIVDFFGEKLTGIGLNFADKFESVYYVDELTVKFGKIYTDEIRELIAQVDELKEDIQELDGKTIASSDKDLLEGLYTRYNELPQAYRFTVDNSDLLTSAISDYFSVLRSEEEENGGDVTSMRLNEILGLTQVSDFTGGTYSFDTEEHLEGEHGSLKLVFDGSMDWLDVNLTPSKATDYDELHVWVKNVSEKKRAIFMDWHGSNAQYDVNGKELNLPGGYVLPANSGWIKLVYTAQFKLGQWNIVSLNDGNGAIKTVDTLYVGKVIAVSNANKVNQAIEALPAYAEGYSAENKAAVVAARNAYNALCMASLEKITDANVQKLISLEADIWREGFDSLPATVEELTEYTDAYKTAIDALKASYDLLDSQVKKAVESDKANLDAYEAKILSFRAQIVNTIVNGLTVKDTLYTLDEITQIKTAASTFAAMAESEKENLEAGVETKLGSLKAKIAGYYTLADLGGSYTSDIVGAGDWAAYTGNLVNKKEGTIVFKVKGMKTDQEGALYVSLFQDSSINPNGNASDGVAMWVRNSNDTLLFQNAGDKVISFNDGKSIDESKTYVFYYTYKVADDYSKLTVSIRVDEVGGDTIANGSVDITSFKLDKFGDQTVESWLTTHENKDNHQTFFINTGYSTSVDISSAW